MATLDEALVMSIIISDLEEPVFVFFIEFKGDVLPGIDTQG